MDFCRGRRSQGIAAAAGLIAAALVAPFQPNLVNEGPLLDSTYFTVPPKD